MIATETVTAAVEQHQEDLISLVQSLVRAPSLTGEEGAAQEVVAAAMRDLGLAVDVWEPSVEELAPYAEHVGEFETLAGRPNVVGVWQGAGSGRSIILNGHIDTVEPGNPDLWDSPPFSGAVVDGTIVGRGSLDMKGGVATNIIAVKVLKSLGFEPDGDIIVQSVISEEDGGAGTLAAVLRGYRADGAIITEPTDLELLAAHAGSLVFRIHVEGLAAHGGLRDEGVSAFEAFIPVFQALLDFEKRRNETLDHPLFLSMRNKVPINVGVVRSGSWPSSVPEWLIAEGRAGLVPGETLDQFKRELTEVIVEAAARHPWLADHPPRVEWFSGQFAPSEIDTDHPLVEVVSHAHATAHGAPPPIGAIPAGTDMRHFVLFGDTPCVIYGAGNPGYAHQTNESIVIDDLIRAVQTIVAATIEWTSAPPE
jgi:acetylornithine deacetylase